MFFHKILARSFIRPGPKNPLSILLVMLVLLNGRFPQSSIAPFKAGPESSRIVIGYYPSWKKTEFDHTRIDYSSLTHIAQAFAWPDGEGNLVIPEDYLYPELVQTAHENRVRIMMSIGGWGNCEGFPAMVSRDATRQRFIDQVIDFCLSHEYDGVDLDWEFIQNSEEQKNFVLLMKELSSALKSQVPVRLLTIAVPASQYWGQWISFEELVPYFDYISFMTYDFHGPWSGHSGHNAPLYSCQNDACGSVNDTFLYACQRGVPLHKMILGIPFYGRSFDCGGLYQKFQRSEYYSFAEVIDFQRAGWSYHWDSCAQVPYLIGPDGNEVISYDGIFSVYLKCLYVVEKRAAGLMIWELGQDSYQGISILLNVIGTVFLKKTDQTDYGPKK
jgi:chitinase